MKKLIISFILLSLSYCAEKMEQDSNYLDSEKSDQSSSGYRAIVSSIRKMLQKGKNVLSFKKKDSSVSKIQNVTAKEEKSAMLKLEIIYRIIGSCKKIHEYFFYTNMQESEYDNIYNNIYKIDINKDVKYSILKKIFNLLPDGYMHAFKKPISTFNLMFSFSDFTRNFIIREKKLSSLKSITKAEITDYNNPIFAFSYQIKKRSPWQLYYIKKMTDYLGVQSLKINNGIISVNSKICYDEIENDILFEQNFFDFSIINIPTYLFIFSGEKMCHIINTYVQNDEFIFPKFISHSYKIIGFLVHNVDKKTINYFEVINNMVHFCNNGTELTTEEIMNPNGEIWNNDGDVVFMVEKIEN